MEPEVRAFLVRIMQTISWALLWMLTNTFFGIKMGLLFAEDGITVWTVVYYVLMVATGITLFIFLRRKWKHAPKFDRDKDEWVQPS